MPGSDLAAMTPPTTMPHAPCIGVFDSGLGGLSVLRAVRRLLPQARLLYVADSGFAPYGEREASFVQQRSMAIAQFLRRQGAQLLVVACNTATAAAVQLLREQLTGCPIVGVEPGVKPAAAATRNGRIGVLATGGTLRSGRFQLLAQAHAAHVELYLQPCPGLAAAIEGGDLDAAALLQVIERCCAPLRAAAVDTVVLGCTHYVFVAHHIQAALGPSVRLIDTAEAVARRTAQLLPHAVAGRRTGRDEPVRLWTTGDAQLLGEVTRRWLDFPCRVGRLADDLSDRD
jgi:glutamate racemase